MGAHDGAARHLEPIGSHAVHAHGAVVQRLQDRLPQPRQRSAPELPVEAGPLALTLRTGRATQSPCARSRSEGPREAANTPSSTRRWSPAGRPCGARTARRTGSKNAHSAFDIGPRAMPTSLLAGHQITDPGPGEALSSTRPSSASVCLPTASRRAWTGRTWHAASAPCGAPAPAIFRSDPRWSPCREPRRCDQSVTGWSSGGFRDHLDTA